MATEDFKELTEDLFDKYVYLKTEKTKDYKVDLSFKEYLNFYIEYMKLEQGLDLSNFEEDEEDEEDEDDEDLE